MISALPPVFWLSFSGFIIAFVALIAGRSLAVRLNYVDQPGGRKQHEAPVPPIGGLVIFSIFIGLSFIHPSSWLAWPVLAGLGALLIMGAIDDVLHINAWIKFALQVWVASFVVIFGGIEIDMLGNLLGFGEIRLGYFAKPFSVMCLVLLMNAINMMDGLDGLSGGFSAIVLLWLILASLISGVSVFIPALLCLLMPLLVFLVLNMRYPGRRRAAVFMGDAGTLSFGLILGVFCIEMSQSMPSIVAPVSVIWIIALPVFDTIALSVLRIGQGNHPFEPDRNHFHHRFVDRGVPVVLATAIILSLATVSGCIGFGLEKAGVPHVVLFALWTACLGSYIAVVLKPNMLNGFLARLQSSGQK